MYRRRILIVPTMGTSPHGVLVIPVLEVYVLFPTKNLNIGKPILIDVCQFNSRYISSFSLQIRRPHCQ